MKIIVTAIVLFLTNQILAQDIPKNATTIIVKGVAFNNIVNCLLDSGFVVDKMDKEYQTLKTEYKKLCKDCIPEILFNVRVKDSIATITGNWRSTVNLFGFAESQNDKDIALVFEIKNEKSKVPKEVFKAMNKFALALKGEVQYLVIKGLPENT